MKPPKATVRLSAVVKTAGQPRPVTLWVNPQKDKDFQTAVKQNRVVTIKQETVGTRKDYGVVGFHREDNVSYWVFPKPLDSFAGKRIIGIDYGLLQLLKVKDPIATEPAERSRKRSAQARKPAHVPQPAPPALTTFRVTVRYTSTLELAEEIEARNKKEAKEKAQTAIPPESVDFSKGTQQRRVVRIEDAGAVP